MRLFVLLFLAATLVRAQKIEPLKLEKSIPLPEVRSPVFRYSGAAIVRFRPREQYGGSHWPTVKGTRTGFFAPELNRLFVAVRRQGSTPDAIQVFDLTDNWLIKIARMLIYKALLARSGRL
jgi:hypothetical protein